MTINPNELITQDPRKKVLIYEDDNELSFMCKLILERNHYEVKTFPICDTVLEDIDRYNPDVILMDLWIPEIGGKAATILIKTTRKTRPTPVILFSANTDIQEICAEVEANDYLKKPFEIKHLLETVGRTIEAAESKK